MQCSNLILALSCQSGLSRKHMLTYWLNMCYRYDTDAGAMRLAAYSATRAAAVFALLGRMSILAESVELARATGLTLANVLYNAQVSS
jgi:hypothetical protein